MAQIANTHDSYDAKGIREDLSDIISRVTPSDTPCMTAIGRTTAKATFHEWQTHALGSVNTSNAAVEGDEFAYVEPTATTRVGNRTQILTKQYLITGTLEAVDRAGRDSEIAFQRVAKGLELKRDMEAMILGKNAASVAGTASVARISGSLSSWLTSNDFGTPGTNTGALAANRGATGAAGGYSTGTGLTVAATDGTTRTFIQSMLDNVIGKMYVNSGMVDDAVVFAGPTQKTALTNFDGIASQVQTQSSTRTIMNTADVFASQFGDIKIVPNRYIRQTSSIDREVYIVRPAFARVATLRPIQEIQPAVTGDAQKRVLLVECTLQVDNEAAHGVVADLG